MRHAMAAESTLGSRWWGDEGATWRNTRQDWREIEEQRALVQKGEREESGVEEEEVRRSELGRGEGWGQGVLGRRNCVKEQRLYTRRACSASCCSRKSEECAVRVWWGPEGAGGVKGRQ